MIWLKEKWFQSSWIRSLSSPHQKSPSIFFAKFKSFNIIAIFFSVGVIVLGNLCSIDDGSKVVDIFWEEFLDVFSHTMNNLTTIIQESGGSDPDLFYDIEGYLRLYLLVLTSCGEVEALVGRMISDGMVELVLSQLLPLFHLPDPDNLDSLIQISFQLSSHPSLYLEGCRGQFDMFVGVMEAAIRGGILTQVVESYEIEDSTDLCEVSLHFI